MPSNDNLRHRCPACRHEWAATWVVEACPNCWRKAHDRYAREPGYGESCALAEESCHRKGAVSVAARPRP